MDDVVSNSVVCARAPSSRPAPLPQGSVFLLSFKQFLGMKAADPVCLYDGRGDGDGVATFQVLDYHVRCVLLFLFLLRCCCWLLRRARSALG